MTDAIPAMGLPPGRHTLGQQKIEIKGLHAYVAGLSFFSVAMNPNMRVLSFMRQIYFMVRFLCSTCRMNL